MRLQFAPTEDRLFGRARELEVLESAYQEIQNREGRAVDNPQEQERRRHVAASSSSVGPQLILLEGMSGTGKTSLVHHFGVSCSVAAAAAAAKNNNDEARLDVHHRQNLDRKRQWKHNNNSCCYIKGKFNKQHQKPYAAFAEAFEDLLSCILKNRGQEAGRLDAIRQALQGDDILVEIMPSLSDILSSDEEDNDEKPEFLNYDTTATILNKAEESLFARRRRRSRRSSDNSSEPAPVRGEHGVGEAAATAGGGSMLEQRHRLNFRFQAFVRAVCQDQPQPLLLFLDDLQWVDAASLELFRAILDDTTSNNILVIGAYRGQEVQDDAHPLRAALSQLEIPMLEQGRYQELTLNDLDLTDLNDFVAASMELAPEKTLSLSKVILRKTHGNIFYSKEFLKHLEAQKLIRYDLSKYQWTWDVEEISGSTNISDNVVDLVTARIRQLPESAVWILKVCSCLWFSFDVAVLDLIVMQARQELNNPQRLGQKLLATTLGDDLYRNDAHFKIDIETQSEVMQGLLLATEQGLLDRMQTNSFKFAHDKIREAAYGLIEEGDERDRMHFVIGESLFRMYHSEKSQQWMLFSSVDQINKIASNVHSPKFRLRLAEVNLEAAECATSISAFLPAIVYLKAGIDLLGDSRWNRHYGLCVKLYSELAALESSVGHTNEAAEVIGETIKRVKAFEDKLPVLTTRIESLSVQGKLNESLDLAFEVLEGLGEHFPLGTKGRTFEKRVKEDKALTARLLSRHTDATILNLPLLVDEKKQYALRILNLMVDPSFHTGQMSKLFLIINRMVCISIISGLGRSSGVAFALYGFCLSSDDGCRKENYRYGKLAVMLQEKLMAREYDCRVLTYVYVLLNHWQEPLQKSLTPLLSAHSAGMEKGDIDYAFQAAGAYLTLYWYSGHDLKFGVSEAERFMGQMKNYKQDKALTIYLPLFQCMLNMTGKLEDALLLKGEAISDVEFEEKKFANTTLMSYQMQLAYYFGDMKLAEDISMKLQEVSKSFNAHYLFVARQFFFGMIALRVALDTTGKRRKAQQLKIARGVIKEMEQWTRHGGLNCLHKLLILKAELLAFEFDASNRRWWRKSCKRSSDFESVRAAFDTAIAISSRTGFRNDAALASERASAFFQRCGNTFLTDSYQLRATKFYMDWGATAKVEQLASLTSESLAFHLSNRPEANGRTLQQTAPEIDHGKLGMSLPNLGGSRTGNSSMFFSDSRIKTDLSPSLVEASNEK